LETWVDCAYSALPRPISIRKRADAGSFIHLLGLGRSAEAGLQLDSLEVAMTTITPSTDIVVSVEPLFTGAERIALPGFLAGDSGLTQWRQLLAIADQLRDNGQRQLTAARAKDVTAFVTTVHAAQTLIDQLDSDGAHFGFTSTSACGQVFG
jgi:hypothetical protein